MNDNFTRTREGGSVATYIIVGLVLAVLVIGGIYTVRKSGQEQPASSPSPSPSVAKSPSASPSKSAPATKSPTPSKKPAPTVPRTGTAPLPATGPTDSILNIVMLAVLVGVATAYIQSYRLRLARVTADNR